MRNYLILIIALIATPVFGDENTSLYDFRYWTAPDNTRIVIDTEEDALFNVSKQNDYVIISFDDAEVFSETFSIFFLMIRRPPRSTLSSSSAASDVYKRQIAESITIKMMNVNIFILITLY